VLLEREDACAALERAFRDVRRGDGRLVLVSGEAGIGKSALVRAFCSRCDQRLLAGACDGLRTPRPLGPLLDIAALAGGPLERSVGSGEPPHAVFAALAGELRASPAVVVFEDVHRADEASLEILGMLGRRVERLGVLVLVTYRADELPRTHPLRVVLGDLATLAEVIRIPLEPLSPDAVEALAAPYGVDATDLHAKTGGNPFFVTEALASGRSEVPATVRDAVLARTAYLGKQARDLLDAVAIVPERAELWLLEAIARDALDALDECLESGVLRAEESAVAFRHELARMAIEETINPHRRTGLHRAVLTALREPPAGRPDLARLAHHAEAADDAAAVLELAPAAAARAAAVGAHREAAAQYARALRCEGLPPRERAELLERHSFESYLIGQGEDSIGSLEQALACWRAIGDAHREGLALYALARRRWCASDTDGGVAAMGQAVELLERLGPGPDLARAYAGASSLAMNLEKADDAFAWGERALALIDPVRDPQTFAYQLNNTGTMALLLGRPEGRDEIERSIAVATAAGLHDDAGRGYIHLAWAAARNRDFALIDRLAAGIEYCIEHGLELWRLEVMAYRARARLDQGCWDDAAEGAAHILRQPNRASLLRLLANTVLTTVLARRGDPGADAPLEEARAIAAGKADLQHLAPVAIAGAEAAALARRADLAADASDAVLALATERRATWISGELAFWRRRAGIDEPIPPAAEPFAVHLAGDCARAAQIWEQLGCPYEAALAEADAGDGPSLRRAFDALRGLGAEPAAAQVARKLRERGERGLSRGPRAATRANPAGLTARQLEVLRLVAEGRRNAEIARELVVSERTVDHHVAAILHKLDAHTRTEATAQAVRLGITGEDR